MLKKISEESCKFIKEKISNKEFEVDLITEENIWDLFDFFEMLEISFSNDIDSGINVDRTTLNKICAVVDELNVGENEQIDIKDLNERLGLTD